MDLLIYNELIEFLELRFVDTIRTKAVDKLRQLVAYVAKSVSID